MEKWKHGNERHKHLHEGLQNQYIVKNNERLTENSWIYSKAHVFGEWIRNKTVVSSIILIFRASSSDKVKLSIFAAENWQMLGKVDAVNW